MRPARLKAPTVDSRGHDMFETTSDKWMETLGRQVARPALDQPQKVLASHRLTEGTAALSPGVANT